MNEKINNLIKANEARSMKDLARVLHGLQKYQGEKGNDGIGIKKMKIDPRGHLIVFYTDGIKQDLGKIVPKMPVALKGAKGETGIGVKDAFMEDGDLFLQFTNGKVVEIGNIKGEKGDVYELTDEDKEFIALSVESQLSPALSDDIQKATKPEKIVEKLESLAGEGRLDASAIKNLPDFSVQLQNVQQMIQKSVTRGSVRISNADGIVGTAHNLKFVGMTVQRVGDDMVITGSGGGGGSSDHGALTGLDDDDHPHYYNSSRLSTWWDGRDTDGLDEGSSNLYFTNERVDDRVASLLQAGTGISLSYDDVNGELTISASGGGGSSDHGSLSGLDDDDHTQYHTDGRADTWLAGKDTDDVSEGTTNLYHTDARVSANTDVSANTSARHSHSNKAVLDATTASFTTADETKLDGVETGATANDTDANLKNRANHTGAQAISTVTGLQTALDGKAETSSLATVATSGSYDDLSDKPTIPSPAPVDSVNGETGVVVLDTDDISEGTTNKYVTSAQKTKLDGIEAGADVTDATNVASAGALMSSDMIDEDDMASDSATKVPTQQSVKAYVDAQSGGTKPSLYTEQSAKLVDDGYFSFINTGKYHQTGTLERNASDATKIDVGEDGAYFINWTVGHDYWRNSNTVFYLRVNGTDIDEIDTQYNNDETDIMYRLPQTKGIIKNLSDGDEIQIYVDEIGTIESTGVFASISIFKVA